MIRSTAIRQSKRKKKRKESLGSLKKKAWDLYSKWIRQREADYRGMAACVSCTRWERWQDGDAGHFIPKSRGLVYYFNDKNVHFQCKSCNLYNVEMAKINYTVFMVQRYGPGIVEELDALSKTPVKYCRADYLEMIELYKSRLSVIERAQKWNVPHGTSEVA